MASKVFKPKKRKIQVEDEENCKEEWSKRKKAKLSYIKPSKNKICKAFTNVINKSVGEMNMMGNSKSREVLTSKEVILPKQDQVISTSLSNTPAILLTDVEIISDLDIVEMSSIDYKLPGFQPLTYMGQKEL